jgi:uncharacterized membrane protein YjfL (UPF0719 family)
VYLGVFLEARDLVCLPESSLGSLVASSSLSTSSGFTGFVLQFADSLRFTDMLECTDILKFANIGEFINIIGFAVQLFSFRRALRLPQTTTMGNR